MKTHRFVFISLIFLSCRNSNPPPIPVPNPAPNPPPSPQLNNTQLLINAYNQLRASKGLAPLTQDLRLQKTSEMHASDMAANGVLSHTGTDGSSPFTRITASGYSWSEAGENIAYGQSNVPIVMTAWESNSAHLKIILGPYKNIGAACILSPNGIPYWCVDLASP